MAIVFVTVLSRSNHGKLFLNITRREDTRSTKNCVPLHFTVRHCFTTSSTVCRQAGKLHWCKRSKDNGMGKTVFVPLTDDLLYEHPERILGPVIPFSQSSPSSRSRVRPFNAVTPDLDANTKKTVGANPANRSKPGQGFASRRVGALALGQQATRPLRLPKTVEVDRESVRKKATVEAWLFFRKGAEKRIGRFTNHAVRPRVAAWPNGSSATGSESGCPGAVAGSRRFVGLHVDRPLELATVF